MFLENKKKKKNMTLYEKGEKTILIKDLHTFCERFKTETRCAVELDEKKKNELIQNLLYYCEPYLQFEWYIDISEIRARRLLSQYYYTIQDHLDVDVLLPILLSLVYIFISFF